MRISKKKYFFDGGFGPYLFGAGKSQDTSPKLQTVRLSVRERSRYIILTPACYRSLCFVIRYLVSGVCGMEFPGNPFFSPGLPGPG